MTSAVLGWDIGGVNTKVARIDHNHPATPRVVSIAYELQRDLSALPSVLRSAADQLGATPHDQHGITMTAELSQAFRTKREGVAFVLDAMVSVFPSDRLHVYTVPGEFVSPEAARIRTLEVAASNWSATAHWVARRIPTCILIDVGSTTTDLIPIVEGELQTEGDTDPDRLLSGELVYTGAVRTPVEAVATRVPLWNGSAGVSAEAFARMGDVYVWLRWLDPENYTSPTPDGRPATREYAGERLARAVCADREMLDEPAITGMATAFARAQSDLIADALRRLRQRHPLITSVVLAGLGEFIGRAAAECSGLEVRSLTEQIGSAAITAPAFAVASLLVESLTLQAG
jgi:(4-(4-[2-(gamma-L-glutamylamino)ethyl]phenoxymethyl)furan-2-yl)methanamine synthase